MKNLEEEIIETIQQIAAIFAINGIAAGPAHIDFYDVKIAKGMEKMVITEMIMYLEELFSVHLEENKKVHKYVRYAELFHYRLIMNTEGANLAQREIKVG